MSKIFSQVFPPFMAAAAMLAGGSCCLAAEPAASSGPIKVAVFPFELEDFSAAAEGGSAPNEAAALTQSMEEAKRLLNKSGRYTVVDTAGANVPAKDGLRNCGGCEGPVAAKLGADEALLGVVTKVSMTEYRIQLQVRDAHDGRVLATYRTDLRMGADYAWSRGVRWLMENQVLSRG